MTVLSSLYGIIIHRTINGPCHRNNVVDGLNGNEKCFLKEQMELLGKVSNNYTSNIGMLHSASKYVSINFAGQF